MNKNMGMDDKELLRCEQISIKLALEAGQMISAASGKNKEVNEKECFADLVAESDKAIEEFLFTEFKLHFPNYRFIGEESSAKVGLTPDPTWIIDPIDGTMNFIHTNPFVCVSIGLTVNKIPVLGIVYSPFLNKLYTAKKGSGAFCNGRPISVRKNCNSLREALIVCGMVTHRDEKKRVAMLKNLEAVGWLSHGIRTLGSGALEICYIAEGFADGYHFGLHVWDMAAAVVILTEAGGSVMATEGGPLDIMNRRILCACSQKIAFELSKSLQVHLEEERD